MKIVLKEGYRYLLRFDRDEEVVGVLGNFCQKEGIKAGYFGALGAAREVVLSSYDLERKEYRDKVLKGEKEPHEQSPRYLIQRPDGENIPHQSTNSPTGKAHGVLGAGIEIAALFGNVSLLGSKHIIHAHGTFADKNFRTYAGHIKRLVISATCEMVLERFKGKVERKYDKKTGLNLLR